MRLKHPRVHDAKHLDFIRSLPCASCGNDISTEAAHLRTGNLKYGKRETGMQEKPSDKWALPLCSVCHREQHDGDESLFWAMRGINPWVLSMTLHDISGDHELAVEVMRQQKIRLVA